MCIILTLWLRLKSFNMYVYFVRKGKLSNFYGNLSCKETVFWCDMNSFHWYLSTLANYLL